MHALPDDYYDKNPRDNYISNNYSCTDDSEKGCRENNSAEKDRAENDYPLANAVRPYRNMLGWPATSYGWAIWVLAGQGMEAFVVPAHLGPRIRHILAAQRLPHPIIATPGQHPQWTFLSEPATGPRSPCHLELANVQQPYGTRIELPPTATPAGPLTWLDPPSLIRQPLPPYHALTAAIIDITGQGNTPRPEAP